MANTRAQHLGVHVSYTSHTALDYRSRRRLPQGLRARGARRDALSRALHRRRNAEERRTKVRPAGPARRTVRSAAFLLLKAATVSGTGLSASIFTIGEGRLVLRTSGDAELELWAAQRHVEPFEELLEKPIRLALQQPAKAETAPRRRISASRTVSS